MVSNRRCKLVIFIFLFFPVFVFAQNNNYFLDIEHDIPRFVQHISWSEDEFALFYEIVIQRDYGEYREYMRESTGETFLNISLPPGKYRFNVLPYDLLGQTGQVSEWRAFEILTAYKPSLEKYYPLVFYMDNYSQRILDINGSNIFDDTEIYLNNKENSLFTIDKNVWGTSRATLYFDDLNLVPGVYEIYMRNPGGLDAAAGEFFIGYRRLVEFYIKFSWTPVIPIYGKMFDAFDSKLYLTGAEMNFGAVTSERSSFNYGLDLSASFFGINSIFSAKSDFIGFFDSFTNSETGAAWAEFSLNALVRKYFLYKLMAVTLRAGCGFSVTVMNEGNTNNDFAFQWNLGLSYLLRLLDVYHIELGIDLIQYDIKEPSGFIKPRFGMVWKF